MYHCNFSKSEITSVPVLLSIPYENSESLGGSKPNYNNESTYSRNPTLVNESKSVSKPILV
jgi:hypothetical protein